MKNLRVIIFTLIIMICIPCISQYNRQHSDSIFNYGVQLYEKKKYNEAIKQFVECDNYDRQFLDSANSRLEYCKMWIGCCYYHEGDEKKAIQYNSKYYKFQPINRTLTYESDSLSDIYMRYYEQGEYIKAITVLEKIISIETKKLGERNYWVANTINHCASDYEDLDSMEIASQLYKKAYDIRKAVLDSSHIDMAESMINVAYFCKELHIDNIQAISLYTKGFEIFSRNNLLNTFYCAYKMHSLATLLMEERDNESAINYELQSISIFKRNYGVHNERINALIARGYNTIMIACFHDQRYGDAVKYGERALRIRKEVLGDNHPYYINTLNTLALIYAEAKEYDKALQLDSIALANYKKTQHFSNDDLQEQVYYNLLSCYASNYEKVGQYGKSIEMLNQLIDSASLSHYDRTKTIMKAKYSLAASYMCNQDYKKAIKLAQECIDYYKLTGDYSCINENDPPFLLQIACYANLGDFEMVKRMSATTPAGKTLDLNKKEDIWLLYNNIGRQLFDNKHYIESISFYNEALKIAREDSKNMNQFISIQGLLLNYLYLGKPNISIQFVKEAMKVVEKEKGGLTIDEDYIEMISELSAIFKSAYDKGFNYLDSAIYYRQIAYEYRFQKKDIRYFDELYKLADYYRESGEKEASLNTYQLIIDRCIDVLGKNQKDSMIIKKLDDAFYSLFSVYRENINYFKQIEIAKRYFSIFHSPLQENYLKLLKEVVVAYNGVNNYKEAIDYGELSVKCYKEVYGDNSHKLVEPLLNLASAYYDNGNIMLGITRAQQAADLMEKITNKYSIDYLMTLDNMASCYEKFGQIENSIEYHLQALDIATEIYGDNSLEAALFLNNLSTDYELNGEVDKSIELIKKAIGIRKELLGEDSYQYAWSLGNLGHIYLVNGKYQDALEALKRCIEIEEKNVGSSSVLIADRLIHIGNAYYKMNDFSQASNYFQKAHTIFKQQGDQISPVSSDALLINGTIVDYYCNLGAYSECSNLLCQELMIIKNYITMELANIQEQYRSVVWDKCSSFILQKLPILTYATRTDSLIEKMYDYSALFGKGLMLNSHNTISQIIMNSDSLNIDKFKELNETKALRDVELSKPIDNRIEDVDELDVRIRTLENSLIISSLDYATYKNNLNLTWRDIQSKLGDKDLAIEFYSVAYPDSVIYMALTVKKGYQHPKLTRLCDLKEMPKWKWGTEETKNFYKLIWEPLEQEFEGVDNIFFSTWYRLNSIPLENLPNSQGQYMSDIYNMYRLSSTRELVTSQVRPACSNIAIYGGLDYNNINSTVSLDTSSYISAYRGVLDSINARGGVDYLPYSLEEAKSIAKEARRFGISNSVYMGTNGTEESFKRLSNSNVDLIHLATHGFYYNADVAKNAAQNLNYQFLFKKGTTEEKALNRSFLIMAGGNRLTHRDSIPEGKDDGILTAKEVSIMNLQNVNILVLSACQSGLGDLSSEGVMGLQQGFKKAGVNTIVMALDNIDDEATQLFMDFFYKNLFSGKSKRESMTNAQKQLRAYKHGKYDKPEYWASFIMLDGIK